MVVLLSHESRVTLTGGWNLFCQAIIVEWWTGRDSHRYRRVSGIREMSVPLYAIGLQFNPMPDVGGTPSLGPHVSSRDSELTESTDIS
jgi:hypothetical protein